jgi:hypothetical protein
MRFQRSHAALAVLIAGIGIAIASYFVVGPIAAGLLGAAVVAGLAVWMARTAKSARTGGPTADAADGPKPATAPPDGHIRFTLVVEGLEADRIAEVWADLCRPDRVPTEEFRQLFRNFTVVEGKRFRFLKGDPRVTAELLSDVLGGAAGVPVRTRLEPAAERIPPWS